MKACSSLFWKLYLSIGYFSDFLKLKKFLEHSVFEPYVDRVLTSPREKQLVRVLPATYICESSNIYTGNKRGDCKLKRGAFSQLTCLIYSHIARPDPLCWKFSTWLLCWVEASRGKSWDDEWLSAGTAGRRWRASTRAGPGNVYKNGMIEESRATVTCFIAKR